MLQFVKLNNQIINSLSQVSGNAIKIYIILLTYSDPDAQKEVFPSLGTLSERSGLALNTIRNSLYELENFGFLRIEWRNGKSPLFNFCTSSNIEQVQKTNRFKKRTGSKIESNPFKICTGPVQILSSTSSKIEPEQETRTEIQETDIKNRDDDVQDKIVLFCSKYNIPPRILEDVTVDENKLNYWSGMFEKYKIKNPAGWLVKAIREKYDSPPVVEQKPKKEKKQEKIEMVTNNREEAQRAYNNLKQNDPETFHRLEAESLVELEQENPFACQQQEIMKRMIRIRTEDKCWEFVNKEDDK